MTPLSSSDLVHLARAQGVLLGVLDHPTAESWMRAVATELKGLFAADQVLVTAALPSGYTSHTDWDESATRAYFDHYHTVDTSGAMVASLPDPFSTEEDRFGAAHEQFVASEIYHDFFLPNRLDDALSLVAFGRVGPAPVVYERYPVGLLGNIHLAGSPVARGPAAAGARTMLALLQPAFAASTRVLQDVTLGTAAAVEGLAVPAWLFDHAGGCLHETAEAAGLVARLPGADALRLAASRLAAELLAARRAKTPATPYAMLAVGGWTLTLTAAVVNAGPAAVVVRVEGAPVRFPGDDLLRDRFGLTHRQVRVALLLAAGRSAAEIAEALCISVHTARRHTEAVFLRLGVSSRGDVEAVLRRSVAPERL